MDEKNTKDENAPQQRDEKDSLIELQQRIMVLEKTEGRMFEVLKWGFAVFSGIAILFTGVNWWTGKTNYERDKESLQQQEALLEKQFSLSQQETSAANTEKLLSFKNEATATYATALTNLQNQFSELRSNNTETWQKVAMAFTNYFSAVSFALTNSLDQNRSEIRAAMTNADIFLAHTVGDLQTNVAFANNRSMAASLMAQGQVKYNTKGNNPYNLAEAIDSYLTAAKLSLSTKDEINLRRCLTALIDQFLPDLMNKTSKAEFVNVDSQISFKDSLQDLMSDLQKADDNGQYTDDIRYLKYFYSSMLNKLAK